MSLTRQQQDEVSALIRHGVPFARAYAIVAGRERARRKALGSTAHFFRPFAAPGEEDPIPMENKQ